MTITSENFFSWQVSVWLGASGIIIAAVWFATARVRVVWQRVFFRAAMMALCFTPVPALQMFIEIPMTGYWAVVPLWYVLFWSITHGTLFGVFVAFSVWLIVTDVFWVAGLSFHHLSGRSQSALG